MRIFPVDDASRIAEIRRAADKMARQEGLGDVPAASAALIATEISTNILKHAQRGEVCISALSERGRPGVELLAIDRGPGMTNVDKCLTDGYSSALTAGTGLGAVARISQEFDVYSQVEKGTVLVSQVYAPLNSSDSTGLATSVGVVLKAIAGEEISGDAWALIDRSGVTSILLADGLGHGLMAARASAEAISAFRSANDFAPEALLRRVHGALHGTRGAAVAIANIHLAERNVKYVGIGNIAGVIDGAGKSQYMVSHSGTAGHEASRIHEFSYPLPDGALIVMHSDGLTTNWNLDTYTGLRRRHPAVIAGVLYRDATRSHDDACVVVFKKQTSP